MAINRRGFLKRLGIGIAAAVAAAHTSFGDLIPVPKEKVEPELHIRFVRAFDADQDKFQNRWDVLYGFGTLYPDNCSVKIMS